MYIFCLLGHLMNVKPHLQIKIVTKILLNKILVLFCLLIEAFILQDFAEN